VFGEYATTGCCVGIHSIDRGSRNEGQASGGVKLGAGTVEQDDVVLVEVGLAIPKVVRCIRKSRSATRHVLASVSGRVVWVLIEFLIVQRDGARTAGKGKLGCIDADPAKQALQALGNGCVGYLVAIDETIGMSIASRNGELGHAQVLRCDGRLAFVGVAVDALWQAQPGCRRGIRDRIVSTLLGDH
jgi:hypothetical protein